jgi:hypothetical protein
VSCRREQAELFFKLCGTSIQAAELKNNSALPKQKDPAAIPAEPACSLPLALGLLLSLSA